MDGITSKNWGWFLVLGILLVVLGSAAIAFPLIPAVAIEILFGWLLIIGGVAQVVHAFQLRQWKGFLLTLLAGLLYLVVGILMLVYPLRGVVTLTLLLAIFFIIEGIFKIVISSQLKAMSNWGWILCNGVIALILGGLIWAQWPSSAFWVIGLLFGINLIFGGWAMIMLSVAARGAK